MNEADAPAARASQPTSPVFSADWHSGGACVAAGRARISATAHGTLARYVLANPSSLGCVQLAAARSPHLPAAVAPPTQQPSTAGSAGSAAQSGCIGRSGSGECEARLDPQRQEPAVRRRRQSAAARSCKGTRDPVRQHCRPGVLRGRSNEPVWARLFRAGRCSAPTFSRSLVSRSTSPARADPACPHSTATMVELPTGGSFPLQFPGCCRAESHLRLQPGHGRRRVPAGSRLRRCLAVPRRRARRSHVVRQARRRSGVAAAGDEPSGGIGGTVASAASVRHGGIGGTAARRHGGTASPAAPAAPAADSRHFCLRFRGAPPPLDPAQASLTLLGHCSSA